MYYSNELISLSVLALYEGELIGTVDKLYFDNKLKKLINVEIISDNDTRYVLLAKNIYNVGKNAIIVKNKQMVSLKVEDTDLIPCPIGAKAYSIKGAYLGIVNEVVLDDKFTTEKLTLDNANILTITNLASIGKNTIIFSDNNQKVEIKKFKSKPTPKIFKDIKPQIVSIQPVQTEHPVQIVSPPTNEQTNPNFLIGRICTKDIYNFNNELMVKKATKINKKHLKDASRYGKLREIMLYSRDV